MRLLDGGHNPSSFLLEPVRHFRLENAAAIAYVTGVESVLFTRLLPVRAFCVGSAVSLSCSLSTDLLCRQAAQKIPKRCHVDKCSAAILHHSDISGGSLLVERCAADPALAYSIAYARHDQ